MDQDEKKVLYLLKKSKHGILRIIFSRIGIITLILLLQFFFFFWIYYKFQEQIPFFLTLSVGFSVIMFLVLLNCRMNATAKITWLMIMMPLPLFGSLLFWYTQSNIGHRTLKYRINYLIQHSKKAIEQDESAWIHLKASSTHVANLATYLKRSGCFPVYENTRVTYFPTGEAKWEELLKQLEQAKKFVFLEYFIIEEGIMWGKILDVLARKAREGVEIRILYDGTCEFTTLTHDYPKRVRELGIQCKMFAPVAPFMSTHYNYRDHRKILVIDGDVAFNGGINLADEYINQRQKYGHWKDTAVMLQGEAVKSFTLLFLQMWNVDMKEEQFQKYLQSPAIIPENTTGYVIPYGDSPLDDDKVGESVYMDILNRAVSYVHIMTPYLILDGEMENALIYAAKRGIEVEIILPGIPDKKAPYALAKTHYKALLEAGVRIYEYTPGFVHAKVFVADHKEAVVGTINLDYRSLYHHFECATYLFQVDCIGDIEQDFQETKAACRLVTWETIKREPACVKIMGFLMKIIAPLM